ncbi:transposase [Butyricicoccus sp. AM05-1]|uniref:transposase n=1 Tax=Butyricicoccus sp. AM05-1 TaxID=2292004 RepID=UPI0011C22C90|nr:transposase [Butyricicoccus sp. AM05-1]
MKQDGHRGIIAAEPMAEESKSSCGVLFQNLKDCGLSTPKLIISDAHSGLVSAIRESFSRASWQRCKVHFMRNSLAYVPQKEKKSFAETLKEIWPAPTAEFARKRAYEVIDSYAKRFPKAVSALKTDWKILWSSMHSQCWMREKSYLPT